MATDICFVSGHYFGFAALKGILSSIEYSSGKIRIRKLISLGNDKKAQTVGFIDFTELSIKYKIPHYVTNSIKSSESVAHIRKCDPDFILIIGWSELAHSTILDIPKNKNNSIHRNSSTHGCIGMHPTLLPIGRGRAPIPWTIIKDLRESGVTAFFLDEKADSGGIIEQERVKVDRKETSTSLFTKCANAHYLISKKLATDLANKTIRWNDQDEEKATYWPKRSPEDGIICFDSNTEDIDRFIRALMPPYPGAFFIYKENKIKIMAYRTINILHNHKPGKIVEISETGLPTITLINGYLVCLNIESSGKKSNFNLGDHVNSFI